MIDNRKRAGSESPIEFVKTRGSQVAGRYKDKKERITEAMSDLQLAIAGLSTKLTQPEQLDQLSHSGAAFARACSIFLRKMVIGDRNKSGTRLLDHEISRSLALRFHRLKKVSPNRKSLDIVRNFNGGIVRFEKLDEPQSVSNMPIAPLQLKISVEWPLPGTISWTETPTKQNSWEAKPEELFDIHSSDTFNCDEWLGQQLVMFDNRGITLRDVIRTVVTYEGAHSINVSRLLQVENEENSKPAKNPELHILNNIKILGVKYTHVIVIESALYLYEKLIKNTAVERPKGEAYPVKLCFFTCLSEDAFSNHLNWLAYDGGIILSFGNKEELISHKIRAVS